VSTELARRLASHLPPGGRVAVGDGAGAPRTLTAHLAEAAEVAGGVDLLLGWCLEAPVVLPHPAFGDVRAIMGGYALRPAIRRGDATYVPARYGDLPALLHGELAPDVLLASLVPTARGLAFATEVGWQQAAVNAGAHVLAEVNHAVPRTAATPALPDDQVTVVAESRRAPIEVRPSAIDAVTAAIGRRAAALVPAGGSLEVAPGAIGAAVLAALEHPIRLRTGAVGDAVVALEGRGLLLEGTTASYVVGSAALYRWADGRPICAGIDVTHDASRLDDGDGFLAINPAFEVDVVGNVNAQGFGEDVVAGVGGLHDFACAAARSPKGSCVIALPTTRRGRATLVDRLSAPPTLERSLVDVVVTERGAADLRGLSDAERTRALRALWASTSAEPTEDREAVVSR
jgi:acyl-CoA hydrolase